MRFFRHFCRKTRMDIACTAFAFLLCAAPGIAQVKDGAGQKIVLKATALRIVTLSPHATELVYAAGAGSKLVGVSDYSDYPAAAKALPKVAAASTVDIERVLALKPDLIVSWASGVSPAAHAQLRKLDIALFESEPRTLRAIADEIASIAALAGTLPAAQAVIDALRAEIARTQQQAAAKAGSAPPVRVFHQIWERPLMTVNGQHIMSDAIKLCGGANVFADVSTLTPTVTLESVIQRDPQLISAGASAAETKSSDPLAQWRAMPGLSAAKNQAFLILDADKFSRASPRMMQEVTRLCAAIEQVRMRAAKPRQ
jgi:iron complex transport system substrate-binding protein